MRKKLQFKSQNFIVLAIIFLCTNITFGQIVLSNEGGASHYVEKILGCGIEVLNSSITGSPDAIASFTADFSTGFPDSMQSGIILSTGSLALSDDLAGTSPNNHKSTDMGTSGIDELSLISGEETFDGIILEFDFIPPSNYLKINFQFGSEEYNNYVNTDYTDLIAILLSGPGITGPPIDLAIAPPGIRPTSNTINNGTSCPSPGINASNPMFYIDNCTGAYNNAMNGFTIMLTAQAEVVPFETYKIRFMIADVIDPETDSWLIIQENGFYAEGIIISSEVVYAHGGTSAIEGCEISEVIFSLPSPLGEDYSFDIEWTGTATYGLDYLPLPPSITFPAGETSVSIPIIVLSDGVIEEIETIIGTFPTMCGGGEVIILLEDYHDCCYPDNFFVGPTGEEQQTLTQGQTLADLEVTAEEEAELVWYSDSYLTTVIPSTTEVVDQTTYYVTQAIDECESDSLVIFVSVTLSNTIFDEKSFKAYPNPVTDIFTISYSKEITDIEVINMLGQIMFSDEVKANETKIDMSVLPSGNYFVKVKTNEAIKVVKVIKQ